MNTYTTYVTCESIPQVVKKLCEKVGTLYSELNEEFYLS